MLTGLSFDALQAEVAYRSERLQRSSRPWRRRR